jgi:hypothetical protein
LELVLCIVLHDCLGTTSRGVYSHRGTDHRWLGTWIGLFSGLGHFGGSRQETNEELGDHVSLSVVVDGCGGNSATQSINLIGGSGGMVDTVEDPVPIIPIN